MKFSSTLQAGILLKRHKSFLVEVALKKDDIRMIFCPNQGQLHGCDILGSRVWFSKSLNEDSRYPLTWELVEVDGGHLVAVNVMLAEKIVLEGIQNQMVKALSDLTLVQENATVDDLGTVVNFAFASEKRFVEAQRGGKAGGVAPDCYVAIKSVTMGDEIHRGFYPDMPLEADTIQLRNLTRLAQSGCRVVLFYCVQHTGVEKVFPADHIDKAYGQALRAAIRAGVEVMAYKSHISLSEVRLVEPVEVCVPGHGVFKKPSCKP